MGNGTNATGSASTSMGNSTIASGESSTAMGGVTEASGALATAMGSGTHAVGEASTAMGYQTVAGAYASLVIGRYNHDIISSPENWVTYDPLLVLGNGTPTVRSNALVVYKNGNTEINGYTKLGKLSEAAPAIKMKEFSAISAATQNTWRDVAHGLTASKILSVSILVDATPALAVQIPPSYSYYPGYEYNYHISALNIVVINSATNSFNILNKPMKILVTYKE